MCSWKSIDRTETEKSDEKDLLIPVRRRDEKSSENFESSCSNILKAETVKNENPLPKKYRITN